MIDINVFINCHAGTLVKRIENSKCVIKSSFWVDTSSYVANFEIGDNRRLDRI